MSTNLLPSTVPQVSWSSSTFTFSVSYWLFSVRCPGAGRRKGQTWVLFGLFWSHHWSKGPPSYHLSFHIVLLFLVFSLSASDTSLCWHVLWAHCHLLTIIFKYPLVITTNWFHLFCFYPSQELCFFTGIYIVSSSAACMDFFVVFFFPTHYVKYFMILPFLQLSHVLILVAIKHLMFDTNFFCITLCRISPLEIWVLG